ncbi:phosphoadenosine phosphosulfate reductase domain-containing protein [Pseudoalteromonas sp.]|uniref:phosphoadenosine phosphosulfate reductase domain-containing protein n=1 Tax=Pseudoalteromonas TaxID=53246 RepID=UPI003F9E8EE6
MCNNDLFDVNGAGKLTEKSILEREEIIKYHAKNPKTAFFSSTSGGKDSMAMHIKLKSMVPADRIIVVHADLGVVEHDGVIHHIENTIDEELHVVRNEYKDFIGMVLLRDMFPSAKFRQCTSDLKIGPIYSFIRRVMKEKGFTHGFNCSGLRAEESTGRAMKNPLWINKALTLTSGARTVFDWMPIFHYSESDVYEAIRQAGQKPHPAYGDRPEGGVDGNSRLSCRFCILGSIGDLTRAADKYTDHYHEMVALERVVDHTMFGKSKVIQTDRKLAKGEALGGGKVTKCIENTGKRAIMPFKCTVFIPIPLDEKIGAPIDELLVRRHQQRLEALRTQLKSEAAARKEAKTAKRKLAASAIGSRNTKRDESTIDFLESFDLTAP